MKKKWITAAYNFKFPPQFILRTMKDDKNIAKGNSNNFKSKQLNVLDKASFLKKSNSKYLAENKDIGF